MKEIRLNEEALGKAIQRYLEDLGYYVHKLQLVHNNANNEFSALATVEKD